MARRGRSSSPRAEQRKRRAPREQMVIYGRNAVREALRGRRRVHRIFATESAAREAFSGAPVVIEDAAAIERRCGSDGHQGVCAEVDPYPYADAAELLAVPDAAARRPRRGDRPAEPRRDLPHGGVGRGHGRRHPRAPLGARSRRRSARPRRERSSTCPSRSCATSPTSSATRRRPTPGATARRPARAPAYDQPDWRGRVVLVLGAEGKGLRPRVADACDDLISLPMRGRIESLNVSATAAAILYEILQQRLDTST